MKNFIKYLLTTSLLILVYACGDLSPTELIVDNTGVDENLQVEVLTDESGYENSATGFDSTGITGMAPAFDEFISISGVKHTYEDRTIETGLAISAYFDKNKPVKNRHGRLIGYKTRLPGRVFFNGDTAEPAPYVIPYDNKANSTFQAKRDTTLGLYYYLSGNSVSGLNFPYNSLVNYKLEGFFSQFDEEFNIAVPEEVTGKINRIGNPGGDDFRVRLEWNGTGTGRIEIVLGAVPINDNRVKPFYRILTKDDGEAVIPANLLSNIDFSRITFLNFSFIRKNVYGSDNSNRGNRYIAAHSIHNIRVKIN